MSTRIRHTVCARYARPVVSVAQCHQLQHHVNAHLLVLDVFLQDAAENLRNLRIGKLDRAKERIDVPAMGSWIFQNPRDHSGLILGSDGSMATGAKRDM